MERRDATVPLMIMDHSTASPRPSKKMSGLWSRFRYFDADPQIVPLCASLGKAKPHFLRRLLLPILVALVALQFFSSYPALSDDHVLRVSLSKNPPLVFTDQEGQASGFFVDIMKHIADQEGWTIQWVPCKWRECLSKLQTSEIDILMSVAKSQERARHFDFTVEPVITNWAFVFRKAGSAINSINDLADKTIATVEGSIHTRALTKTLESFGIRSDVVLVADYPDVLRLLQEGKVSAGVFSRMNALTYASEAGIEKTHIIFSPINLLFATPKGKFSEIREAIDANIRNMKKDTASPYHQILDRWLWVREREVVPYWVWWALLVGAAVFSILGIFIVALRFKVKQATALVKRSHQKLEATVRERTASLTQANETLEKEITERKRVEEELGHFFDVSSDLICVANTDGYFTRVNPVCEQMLGWKESEFVGKPFVDFIHPEDVDATLQEIERQLNGAPVSVFVNRYRCKDGSYRWLEWVATPALGKTVFAIARDITERKWVEEALRESENRYKRLYERAPLGYQSLDIDGNFLEVNQAWLDMFGYAREEVIGRWFGDFVAEKDLFDANFPRFKEAGEIRVPGYEIRCRDGSAKIVAFDGRIGYDEQGRFLQTHCILTDITERQRAESKLLESEERLNEAARIANLGYWLWDEEKDRIVDCSEGFARIYGVTKKEILTSDSGELDPMYVHPDDCERLEKIYQEYRDNPDSYDVEYRIIHLDGSLHYIHAIGKPILNEKGQVVRTFGVTQDITERKRMEQELAHSRKMEAVGQLTGGIAHDFNNLLQIIQSNLWLARDNLEREDEPLDRLGTSELLEEAFKAGNRGAKLTRQLLAFSRKQTLSPKTVDPNELIEGLTKLLGRTLGEDIEIETFLGDDIPPIHVDTGNLENAILNLALNAKGAMPKGGKLTITTSKRNLDREFATEDGALPLGEYVEISVTDTGGGMSAETLDRAIEPFFTTKDVGEGSGLGLSMVYGFTKQSGGHMTIQSEVGKGTTVNILLPVAEAKAAAGREQQKAAVAGKGHGAILVVEDDTDVRRITVMLLNNLGYDTLEAEDALSAIEILKNDDGIDLMFSDVVMPRGITGIELAREVSQTMGTKVLLTSGYPIAELEKSGLSESAFRFLKKPYTTVELSQAVKAILEG